MGKGCELRVQGAPEFFRLFRKYGWFMEGSAFAVLDGSKEAA
jgi:hypothetical protein